MIIVITSFTSFGSSNSNVWPAASEPKAMNQMQIENNKKSMQLFHYSFRLIREYSFLFLFAENMSPLSSNVTLRNLLKPQQRKSSEKMNLAQLSDKRFTSKTSLLEEGT